MCIRDSFKIFGVKSENGSVSSEYNCSSYIATVERMSHVTAHHSSVLRIEEVANKIHIRTWIQTFYGKQKSHLI